MSKTIVGFCPHCYKTTQHKVIECSDTVPWRTFEAIVTLGFNLLFDRDYHCECTKCGNINTIRR